MSDDKNRYSDASANYINNIVPISDIDVRRMIRSKVRRMLFNKNWEEHKVNLLDIIQRFITSRGEEVKTVVEGGIKYCFEGLKYRIKCDMVSGYLTILDKETKKFCTEDGTPASDKDLTHFKIMKREEM